MAFVVPQFPLLMNVYDGGVRPPVTPRIADVPCNLAIGKRVQPSARPYAGLTGCEGLAPTILVPAGYDIRDSAQVMFPDFVEVPPGSQRWYQVTEVSPIGSGFSNLHIAVAVVKASAFILSAEYPGMFWPVPDPLLLGNP